MLEAGKTLKNYRLIDKLGEGGMGVVWRAVDTKLDREVAIKTLPPEFADHPERLARFEREAKLLASLNHRNIASIFGHDEAGGVRFLVMELVEGEDLAQRLERGPLPVPEALDVAHQLARALENAHEQGVLHRDLKPANIRLTHEGRVKVLDFGLAKAFDSNPLSASAPTTFPTVTSADTQAGTIMGTAQYMSPEQARGKPVDKRTDIWAFGCLLYECLTGTSPFRGETVTDTLASIVKTQADWSKLPPDTPPRIRELLERCLEKEARNRLRDVGDARIELQRAIGTDSSLSDSSLGVDVKLPAPARRFAAPWLLLALLVGVVAGVGIWSALGRASVGQAGSGKTVRFSIAFPDSVAFGRWALSPDGQVIAFSGFPSGDATPETTQRIYLRSLDSYATRVIEGSDGVRDYSFSPDGRWLVMRTPIAHRSAKSRLWKVPVDGSSPPLALTDWRDEWAGPLLWLPDGDILVQGTSREFVVRVSSSGGVVGEPLTFVPKDYSGALVIGREPRTILSDGVHVLGVVTTYSERGYQDHVAVLNLATGESRLLIEDASSPSLAPTGHLVFTRNAAVLATEFDQSSLELRGNTVAIEDGFRSVAGYGHALFTLSADGTMLHWPGGVYGDQRQLRFADVDETGRVTAGEVWSDDRRFFEGGLAVSADQRRLAVSITNDSGLYETWVTEMDRPRLSRFVYQPGQDCTPQAWTTDGSALVFSCRDTEGASIRLQPFDSSADGLVLRSWRFPENYRVTDVLPDGSAAIASRFDTDGNAHLELLPLDRESEPPAEPWLADAYNAVVSPDGRRLAYLSTVSGRAEVYLRPLGADGKLGREIPISSEGGGTAWWVATNGALRLEYHNGPDIYSVDVRDDGRITPPRRVASGLELFQKIEDHEHLSDGRWLLNWMDDGEALPKRVNVVLNWTRELEQRMAQAR